MTYLVCQTPKCQQTYPIKNFEPTAKNVSCEKCGGVVIDEDDRANMSQHSRVIPVLTPEELENDWKDKLACKYQGLSRLQHEIAELEQEV